MRLGSIALTYTIALMVCAQTTPGQRQAPTGDREPGAGAISGVVTEASTQRPVADARVLLGRAGSGGVSQLTDAHGRFVFTELAAQTYFINVRKPGFADGHYGPGALGMLGGNIVLGEGEWFREADVQMQPLCALGGTVVDERGEPVVGAYVRVLTQFMLAGHLQLAAGPAAKTDDTGEYRIPNLRPGKYIVTVLSVQHSVPATASMAEIEGLTSDQLAAYDRASARHGVEPARRNSGALVDGLTALILGSYVTPPPPTNGRPRAYPIEFYPGTQTLADASTIDIEAGRERPDINFTLVPVPAVRVSGRLSNATGSFAGYVLRLMPAGLEHLGTGSEAATTLVRPDGSFTFLNVPAGAYTLIAPGLMFEFALEPAAAFLREPDLPSTPGMGRFGSGGRGGLVSGAEGVARNSLAPSTIADDHAGHARVPLTVGPADITDLVVPLQPTARLQVRIDYEDLARPAPTGTLEVMPANGNPEMGVHTARVGGTDESSMANMPVVIPLMVPGEYVLRFIGMTGLTIRSIGVNGDDYSSRPIRLSAGQDAQVVVTLTGKAITLSGVVRDRRGAPVPLASVIAFPTERQLWTDYGFTPTWIRVSVGSSNGAFHLGNLRAGDYYVIAVDASQINAWADPAFLDYAAPLATRMTLDWGDARELSLPLLEKR